MPQILARLGETTAGYTAAAIACYVLGGLIVLTHYLWTEERNAMAKNASTNEEKEKIKPTDILTTLRKNRPYLALCVHGISGSAWFALYYTAVVYVYSDYFGDIGLMSYSSTVATILSVAILAAAPVLAKKIETVRMIRAALVGGILLFALLFVVMLFVQVPAAVYLVVSSIAYALCNMSSDSANAPAAFITTSTITC